MKGIIIAGGLGTRLRPLTYHRPKPLVPVANRPFLEYQVALLRQHGIDDIVFATNYLADHIENYFGDGSRFGVRMRYAIEDQPLGTGGAIRNAAEVFPGEAVAVFNGDILTDFDLGGVIAFHHEREAMATITLTPIERPHPFGVLVVDDVGRVSEWNEPSEEYKKAVSSGLIADESGEDWINAGFYLLEPAFIERIPTGKASSVERDIYPMLLAEGAAIYGNSPGGYWMDVGRPEQLMAALGAIHGSRVKTTALPIHVGEQSCVAESARFVGCTTIGRNCRVGADTVLEDCLILDNVQIGDRVRLRGVIVDEGAVIEDHVVVERAGPTASVPVIAAHSRLARGTRL